MSRDSTTNWREEIENALVAFVSAVELAGEPISHSEITVEYLPAPHRAPLRVPAGKVAVYGFLGPERWLKIGQVGSNSHARYSSQHYNASSAQSTLAGSLVRDSRMGTVVGFDPYAPGDWIRSNTHRVNILLPAERPPALMSFLEAFLHLRLNPRYEG